MPGRLDAYLLDGLITPNNFPDSIVVVKVSTAFIKLNIIYKKSNTPSLCLMHFLKFPRKKFKFYFLLRLTSFSIVLRSK